MDEFDDEKGGTNITASEETEMSAPAYEEAGTSVPASEDEDDVIKTTTTATPLARPTKRSAKTPQKQPVTMQLLREKLNTKINEKTKRTCSLPVIFKRTAGPHESRPITNGQGTNCGCHIGILKDK